MKLPIETQLKLKKFKPRPYQWQLINAIEKEGCKRTLAILPRRAGKDLTAFNLCIRQCLKKVCVVYYVFPTFAQAKRVIWDSITNDGERILDFIPPELVQSKNAQEMKIRFVNGSLLQLVGSDNYDALMGTNPYGVVFSEYSLQDPKAYQFIRPILAANDGWALFISTPRGKTNHLYSLYEIAKDSDNWKCIKLTLDDTQHISDEQMDQERMEMSEDMILQEYYCFPSSQEILTSNTVKSIAEVKQDEMVYTHTGRIRKVTDTMSRSYSGDLIKIKTYGSFEPIICTPEHPLRVYDKETQSYCWKNAQDITRDDNLFFPKLAHGKTSLISYELCMLIAWYVCEGSSFANGLQFTVGKQSEVDRVTSLLSALTISYTLYTKEASTNIVVNSTQLVDFFKSQCGTQSNNKRIPMGLISSLEDQFFHELMLGDGCYFTSPKESKYVFTTTSKTLAYQVQLLANSLRDYAAGITFRARGRCTFPGERVCESQDSYSVVTHIPSSKCKGITSHLHRTKYGIAARIKSAESVPFEGNVYNISVQYDESYLVGGRAAHNCSFDAGVEGAYYAKYIDKMYLENRISDVPWEVGFQVHTAWDLGMNDPTVIIFFQVAGNTIRIIDTYTHSKVGLEHYAKVIQSKPYTYGKHIGPHDIKVKEMGTGMTRLEKARQLGIKFIVAPNLPIEDGIESVRSTLSKVWIDEQRCQDFIKAVQMYRQEFDAKKHIYKQNPLHDWSCFVGETHVLTHNGMRQIMDITENDLIFTKQGWYPCSGSKKTGINAHLVEITFSDLNTVKCTPEHKFLTENGWKSAKDLTRSTVIQSSLTSSLNTLMDFYTDYGLIRDIYLKAENDCIEQYGNQLLDQYQKILIYITKTIIPLIMHYPTLNAFLKLNILQFQGLMQKDFQILREIKQPNGIGVKQEGCGTNDTLNAPSHGQNGKKKSEVVCCAKKSLRVLSEKMDTLRNSVTQIVKPIIIEDVKSLEETADVYCINVPNIHHFSLANGSIVHNSHWCDALRYLCVTLPRTRDIQSSKEELDRRYYRAIYGNDMHLPEPFRRPR